MTKAMALLGVALSTTTGCVTVQGDPGEAGDKPAAQHSHPPRGGAVPTRRPVRSPAKEALSQLPRRGAGPAPSPGAQPPRSGAPGNREDAHPTGTAGHPGQRSAHPRPGPGAPGRAPAPVIGGGTGRGHDGSGPRERHRRGNHPPRPDSAVCELGESYGRWDADSAQARICRSQYGR
ncbi:hypothetical protein [Streptomyces sp. NPDC006925]|uniref:hypothetical protein n=1 Tax=Streptomyces sp. NPDC006925 TaxID=3364768 RepID=UPI00369D4EDB